MRKFKWAMPSLLVIILTISGCGSLTTQSANKENTLTHSKVDTKSNLESAITAANTLKSEAVAEVGNYPAEALETYATAITAATSVNKATGANQRVVDEAITTLAKATKAFKANVVVAPSKKAQGVVQVTMIGNAKIARVTVDTSNVGTQFSYKSTTKALGEPLQFVATDLDSVQINVLAADGSQVGKITVPVVYPVRLASGAFDVNVD